MTARQDQLLQKLQELTLDRTKAECPCQFCMGSGCNECGMTGADLTSLHDIRGMVADALDSVLRERGKTIALLARQLRNPDGTPA